MRSRIGGSVLLAGYPAGSHNLPVYPTIPWSSSIELLPVQSLAHVGAHSLQIIHHTIYVGSRGRSQIEHSILGSWTKGGLEWGGAAAGVTKIPCPHRGYWIYPSKIANVSRPFRSRESQSRYGKDNQLSVGYPGYFQPWIAAPFGSSEGKSVFQTVRFVMLYVYHRWIPISKQNNQILGKIKWKRLRAHTPSQKNSKSWGHLWTFAI